MDDDAFLREFVADALEPYCERSSQAADSGSALEKIESGAYDIVLSDINMPGVPGLELLRLANQSQWDLAIILMTGKPEISDLVESIRAHAHDFLIKPFTVDELVHSVARSFVALRCSRNARDLFESLREAVQRRTTELETTVQTLQASYQTTLEALVVALDAREHETYSHSFRVRAYTATLAQALSYPASLSRHLETAALLHDIGKISIPDRILLKPGSLTAAEFDQMKKHSEAGAQILNRIDFLRPATEIVRHHHERYDGTGYPAGLAGDAIPLGARIFAVADTLDAMTSDRCYRKALPFHVARQEILRCSGSQFDPRVTASFQQIPESVWLRLRNKAEQVHSIRLAAASQASQECPQSWSGVPPAETAFLSASPD